MATYKAVIRPALEYPSSKWSPLASSTSINKLQVMQNTSLRTASGCTQDTNIQYLHDEIHIHTIHGTYSSTHHNTNRKHNISVCEEENVKLIAVELPGVVVHSIYKPPPEPFRLPALGQRNKPHIVIGDFNSYSTLWAYTTTNSDGEYVEQWADSNSLSLIHNAKLPKSFNNAIWKKGYNLDLIFVSSKISDMSLV